MTTTDVGQRPGRHAADAASINKHLTHSDAHATYMLHAIIKANSIALQNALREILVYASLDCMAIYDYREDTKKWRLALTACRPALVDAKHSYRVFFALLKKPWAMCQLTLAGKKKKIVLAIEEADKSRLVGAVRMVNGAAIQVTGSTSVSLALNRAPGAADKRPTWDKATLERIYQTLHDAATVKKSPRQLSSETFERDLPSLLELHHGEWVVYENGVHRGEFKTALDATKFCDNDGIPEAERFIQQIALRPPLGGRVERVRSFP